MPGPMPKFTKTPPGAVAAFEAAAPTRSDVERRTMFGYPALFTRGNMFAFTFGPKIVVRADEKTRATHTRFEPLPGRPMGEYIEVPARDVKGAAALKRWLASALAYADTLPAKAAKTAPKRTPTKKRAR